MACPVMVDLRNVYRAEDMKKAGFVYTCVGRPPSHGPVPIYTTLRGAPALASTESA